MIVLDTNVVSELMRPAPTPAVEAWVAGWPADSLFLSAVGEAELRHGVAIMPAGRRREIIARKMDEVLREDFAGRILAFDSDAAALHLGAVQAMGRNADVYWLPVLEGSLVAEDEDERLAAVQAIGEIGSEDGAPMLLELFDDPSASEELIRGAVSALGEIGSEEAVEELQRLRTHPDPTVRETAQSALEEATWLDDMDDLSPGKSPLGWEREYGDVFRD